MDDILKVCSKCRTPLPLHLFAKDKQKLSGLRSNCKKCDKEYRLGKKLYERRHLSLLQRIKGWFK